MRWIHIKDKPITQHLRDSDGSTQPGAWPCPESCSGMEIAKYQSQPGAFFLLAAFFKKTVLNSNNR